MRLQVRRTPSSAANGQYNDGTGAAKRLQAPNYRVRLSAATRCWAAPMPTPVLAPQRFSPGARPPHDSPWPSERIAPTSAPPPRPGALSRKPPGNGPAPNAVGTLKATAPLSIQRVARFMPDPLDHLGHDIATRRIDRPASLRLRPPGCRIRSVPGALFFVRPRNLVGAALEGRAVQAAQDAAHPSRAPG